MGSYISFSPTIGSDGTIYVGSWDGVLYAIGSTGILDWSYQVGSYISSSPPIWSDEKIYIGSYDKTLYAIKKKAPTPVVTPTPTEAPTMSPTSTPTGTPTAMPCKLYPIALDYNEVAGLSKGTLVKDIWCGVQPENFGWLSWTGLSAAATLCESLTPPGNSHTYINPDNPSDNEINVGDWIRGSTGVMNARCIRDRLDHFINTGMIMAVPV